MVEIVWPLKLCAALGETADIGRTSLNDVTHNLWPQIFACRHGFFGELAQKGPDLGSSRAGVSGKVLKS